MLSVVEFPETGFGVKVPVAPEGRPLVINVTGPAKPSILLIVTV